MNVLRGLAKRALNRAAPGLLWKHRLTQWNWGGRDPELRLLPQLCHPNKTFVDIGGCLGIYTASMLAHSRHCIVFEPRPEQAAQLRVSFADARPPVTVHAVALSDQSGTAELRLCEASLGRSTLLETVALEGEVEVVSVPVQRLDDYQLSDVGLLKIDVEGHEEAVLAGAAETLQRCQPNVVIELQEERVPGCMQRTCTLLGSHGLSGFFLADDRIHPIAAWSPSTRRSNGEEVINFVFMNTALAARLRV